MQMGTSAFQKDGGEQIRCVLVHRWQRPRQVHPKGMLSSKGGACTSMLERRATVQRKATYKDPCFRIGTLDEQASLTKVLHPIVSIRPKDWVLRVPFLGDNERRCGPQTGRFHIFLVLIGVILAFCLQYFTQKGSCEFGVHA